MIFSLLKLSKKTGAVLGGSMIALACLWGIAWWQDLSARQLLNLFLASLGFIVMVMLAALVLVVLLKLCMRLLRRDGDENS